jgi:acetyl-CoA synthetase (ADP-forming)
MTDADADGGNPIATARAEGRTTLTEAESKSLLAEAGIETPAFEVVSDAEAAVTAAEAIGFPVVVKVASPGVTHKSEWGDGAGVVVGLDSPTLVREAAGRVLAAAREAGIDADVLVEAAHDVGRGTEVIVGGLRDPSFGPVVLAGLGGVFTEVYEDTSHRIAPIDRTEARAALDDLTAARLLAGYRGRPAADRDALATVVRRVGDLVVDHDAIAEVDVNPVLATPDGAVALDALVVLDDGDGNGNGDGDADADADADSRSESADD